MSGNPLKEIFIKNLARGQKIRTKMTAVGSHMIIQQRELVGNGLDEVNDKSMDSSLEMG